MADDLIYRCDLCTEKFKILDDLKQHKLKVHSNTIQDDNIIIIPIVDNISNNTDNKEILLTNNISEFQSNKNTSNNEITLIEKPITSEPLLAQNENIILQQSAPILYQQKNIEPDCCPCNTCDCCYLICRCCAECNYANSTTNNANDACCNCGDNDCNCGDCDCDCGDCACADCGGCDCTGCDCTGCDCTGCDCSIM